MENNKHFIKVFFSDEDEGHVLNLDGEFTQVASTKQELFEKIGGDIHANIIIDIEQRNTPIFGYRIDYTLTPITKDPFK